MHPKFQMVMGFEVPGKSGCDGKLIRPDVVVASG